MEIELYTPTYITNLDESKASEAYKLLTSQEKEIDATKKQLTDPLNQALKEVRLRYKPIEDKIAFIKTELKKHLLSFNEARKATLDEKPEEVLVKYKTLTKLKITNSKLVPKRFLIIDESALKQALLNGEAIKGAELEQVQIVSN